MSESFVGLPAPIIDPHRSRQLDPRRQTVARFRHGAQPVFLRVDDDLDLGDVVEGFRCTMREILVPPGA